MFHLYNLLNFWVYIITYWIDLKVHMYLILHNLLDLIDKCPYFHGKTVWMNALMNDHSFISPGRRLCSLHTANCYDIVNICSMLDTNYLYVEVRFGFFFKKGEMLPLCWHTSSISGQHLQVQYIIFPIWKDVSFVHDPFRPQLIKPASISDVNECNHWLWYINDRFMSLGAIF